MERVAFFEKPGCGNNTRQKAWLRERGVTVEAVDLLSHDWSEAELLQFFATLPVSEWFNRSAPRIKAGEVVPEQVSREQALALLLAEPLLIRRPLLRRGAECRVGFDAAAIALWLGLPAEARGIVGLSEMCPRPEHPCVAEEER